MLQNIKSVLIGLTKEYGPDESSAALGYGLSLAREAGAHATVQAASTKIVVTGAWMSGYGAGLVEAENRRLHKLAEAAAKAAEAQAVSSGVVCTTQSPELSYTELLESFTAQARLHDLTVLDAEPETIHTDRFLIENMLMMSGRPVIIVPPGFDQFRCGRAIVAWDGSARAARAVNDALPLLRTAEAVEIVAVTGEKDLPGSLAGAELAPHLSRHGVKVSVKSLPAREGDVAQTLRDAAQQSGADLLVIGGYVHSRLRELLFGGVTQSLLKSSPVPLFMSY